MTKEEIWDHLIQKKWPQINYYMNRHRVSKKWWNGVMRMAPMVYPNLESAYTSNGWRLYPIVGKSSDEDFFRRLSRQTFNINTRLRSEENLAYLEERDTFHDYFGHTPMLCDEQFTEFLIRLGVLYGFCRSDEERSWVSHFYWYTAEFGLVDENCEVCVYGAGIMSSVDEFRYVVNSGEANIHSDFTLEDITTTPYITDGFQNDYFMLKNWDHLDDLTEQLYLKILAS